MKTKSQHSKRNTCAASSAPAPLPFNLFGPKTPQHYPCSMLLTEHPPPSFSVTTQTQLLFQLATTPTSHNYSIPQFHQYLFPSSSFNPSQSPATLAPSSAPPSLSLTL
ncbi:hypothetical protein FGO68_gene15475 [Halteria grandinella]|uniref:Uncharacterized protein n=1 Tax=Halteria grandinella TaxID=5974 RepID=A0A8J8T0Q3_HALGN|nr:hypothetical protein FGO68_gene15475 [Halteria grandinella]